jgi:hypothetical protein
MVNVETPQPRVTLIAADIHCLYSSSSTRLTEVLRFAYRGDLPFEATPDTLDYCHVDTIAKGPGFPRPRAEVS